MPDSDKTHKGLGWGYQKTYKQLCERKLPMEACGRAIIGPLAKAINKRDPALKELLASLSRIPIFAEYDPVAIYKRRDEVLRAFAQRLPKREIEMASEAFTCSLVEGTRAQDWQKDVRSLQQLFLQRMLEADFYSRVQLQDGSSHYAGISEEQLLSDLQASRPSVDEELRKLACQLGDAERTAGLRVPRRMKLQAVQPETDLLTLIADSVRTNEQQQLPLPAN